MLIDPAGNQINSSDSGLLLFEGGTVCDDYFNDNAALAICLEMGFWKAGSWEGGSLDPIQVFNIISFDRYQKVNIALNFIKSIKRRFI